MNSIKRNVLLAVIALAAGGAVNAWMGQQGQGTGLPTLPTRPTEVIEVISALPFTLGESYTDYWTAEQDMVTAGHVLALRVDKDLAYPRQSYNRVLYVGDQVAERVNPGDQSGIVIVVVPSLTNGDGYPTMDLTQVPMWFGEEQELLPEQITGNIIGLQREIAESRGILPFNGRMVSAALATGGGLTEFANRYELDQVIAETILSTIPHTPENQADIDTAMGLQAPLVK